MFTRLRRYRWIILGRLKIKKQIRIAAKNSKIKIIIGSGGTNYEGWIPTDLPHFDILEISNWEYFFKNQKIDNLLAEHVLEHLVESDVNFVLTTARKYLKKGGRFRIAVPDGFHPSPEYLDYVGPTGKTGSLHGHLYLWDHESLSNAAKNAGFKVELLEYYKKDQEFEMNEYSFDHGFIGRSIKNNYINDEVKNYSSLVLDLINP